MSKIKSITSSNFYYISIFIFFLSIYILAANLSHLNFIRVFIFSEYGLFENLSVICAFISILLLAKNFFHLKPLLVSLYIIALFIYIGEELSWGYHFFPSLYNEISLAFNGQKEPNIHNILISDRIEVESFIEPILATILVINLYRPFVPFITKDSTFYYLLYFCINGFTFNFFFYDNELQGNQWSEFAEFYLSYVTVINFKTFPQKD